MNSRNTILEELKTLDSGLGNLPLQMPYSVPEGYFNTLAERILARIKTEDMAAADEIAELSPLLSGLSRKMPFDVPLDYFQANMDDLAGIAPSDEDSVVLSFISKEMLYSVPQGYFEELPSNIVKRVAPPKAKLVSMARRGWMRVAAAAMIAGIITVSGIFYFNRGKDIPVDNPKWVASKLKTVSDKELEEFVKTTDIDPTHSVTANKTGAKSAQNKRLLQDVSDKDLDAFLEQVPFDEEEIAIN
ncbi:MAG TPA: hypothetical protein VNR87_05585 [Flavisolibacter sp.]|nr:hypothetical protein [Flavisolibacter sp.]